MKKVIFGIATIALLFSGCGTGDIQNWIDDAKCGLGIDNCNNNDSNQTATDENATDENATDENATDKNATDKNATDKNATDKNATDKNATDGTTTDNATIDPNACSSEFSSIEDDNNQPQGVSKDGITFTSTLTPSAIKEIFYYEPETMSDNSANYLGEFNDKDDNVRFTLSINSVYCNGKYFYVLNSRTNKCYRGSFPASELEAPNLLLEEVKQ